MNALTSIGFIALGTGYLWELFRQNGKDGTPVGPVLEGNRRSPGPRGQSALGGPLIVKDGIRKVQVHGVRTIDDRLKFIVDQIRRDSKDPKTVTEARAIVSGKCQIAKGGLNWCVPPKDWIGELRMLFWAVTNPNSPYAMRYTRDHATIDMFGSSDSHRRLPSGDCFVNGTLVLRDDHKLVPVETLRVGDRIWGLDKWTTVQQTWDKGVLPTWLIRLNNGSSMRLTPNHKVWVLECDKHPTGNNCTQVSCPMGGRTKKVVHVRDLKPGMMLVQPERIDFGDQSIDPEEAWVEGVFAADGWIDGPNRFAIAG